MKRLIKNLFKTNAKRVKRQLSVRRLGMESLEERRVMAVAASLVDNTLYINGSDQADVINVRQIDGQISIDKAQISQPAGGPNLARVSVGQVHAIVVNGKGGADKIKLNSEKTKGQEAITIPTIIHGGAGNDQIYGACGVDQIFGELGNDKVYANAGNDFVDGGLGQDKLYGEKGADQMFGDDGKDLLSGGDDDDRLSGGAGADKLLGGNGNDHLAGGADLDYLDGQAGDDVLNDDATGAKIKDRAFTVAVVGQVDMHGWFDSNFSDPAQRSAARADYMGGIAGGNGSILAHDFGMPISLDTTTRTLTLVGDNVANFAVVQIDTHNNTDPLDDELVASISRGSELTFHTQRFDRYLDGNLTPAVTGILFYGNDGGDVFHNLTSIDATIHCGGGDDTVYGGSGKDIIFGEGGNDYLHGREGEDYVSGGENDDRVFGDQGIDTITGGNGNDELWDLFDRNTYDGGEGHDTITAGEGNDSIDAGGGDDVIYAGDGSNWVDGGAGHDVIRGGSGNESLLGGSGIDQIFAGAGQDLIYGGDSDDILHGEGGHDTIFGQEGDDELFGDDGNDLIDGGDDDDTIHGGDNWDKLFGGNGHDSVYGDDGRDELSGGYIEYDPTKGYAVGDISDWNFDELYGGAHGDYFWVADKKAPYVWLDSAEDADSSQGDTVKEEGWTDFHGRAFQFWGHQYGKVQ